jgi:iron complex outermembrane receptor protein
MTAALMADSALAEVSVDAELSNENTLEEIVVTAYKREQSLTDVPGSIVAVDAQRLEENGIISITELYRIIPSLNLHEGSSATGNHMRIRGVGNTGTAGLETGVSVVLDGVVTGSMAPRSDRMFDVERVEVLRGPQGTMFGKNASAGIIHVLTKNPTPELEGYVLLEYGEGDSGDQDLQEFTARFGFGGPINDTTGFRIAGFTTQQDGGYLYDIEADEHTNSSDALGLRGKLQYESGSFLGRLSVSVTEEDRRCCLRAFRTVEAPYGGLTAAFLLPELEAQGIIPSADNRVISADANPIAQADSNTTLIGGDLEWAFDNGMTMKSITGYINWDIEHRDDADVISLDFANINMYKEDQRIFSQELQLLSPESEKYDYVVGLYYWDMKTDGERRLCCWSALFGSERDNSRLYTVKSTNVAAYGHLNYNFSGKWRGFAGVRVLSDEIDHSAITVDNTGAGGDPVLTPGLSADNDNDDINWAGTLGIQFYPRGDEGGMMSALVSRGYKGPGINIADGNPGFSTDPTQHPFALLEPEQVLNYELGYKQAFTGRTNALLSFSLFYTTFKDYQTNTWNAATSTSLVQNAAELRTRGFELEVSAAPWDDGEIWVGISYTDAYYESYPDAQCTAVQNFNWTGIGPCLQDLSGKAVAETPEWEFHMAARQEFTLSDKYHGYVSGDFNWLDEITWGTDLDPNTRADSYWLINLRAGFYISDQWELFVYGRNVTDETYTTRIIDAALFSPGAYSQYMAPGRMLGAGFRWGFN